MSSARYARLGAAASVLVVLVAGPGTTSPRPGAAGAPPPSDTRERLELPADLRDLVLAEMRLMLQSVNGVLKGLVADDPLAVEKAARASGMAVAADVDPRLPQRLPQAFLALGMETHRGFDRLADAIKAGGTREGALGELAGVTEKCVACHAAYRIDEAPR